MKSKSYQYFEAKKAAEQQLADRMYALHKVLGITLTVPKAPVTRRHRMDDKPVDTNKRADYLVNDTKIGAIYRAIATAKDGINVYQIAEIAKVSPGVVSNSITRLFRTGKLSRERRTNQNNVSAYFYWVK